MMDQISIGKFGSITKLSNKALRLYEEKELLEPDFRDPINNYRYYRIDQIEDGVKIKMLASLGFGIEEMKAILDAVSNENTDLLNTIFARKRTEIRAEIKRLEKIEDIFTTKDAMELLFMQCSQPELKHIPKLRVVSKRRKGTYAQAIPEMIGELMGIIFDPLNRSNMVKMTGPIMFIAHDREYKEFDADIEIAIPISGRISLPEDDVQLHYLDETDVISVIYTGPYKDVGIGYTRTMDYISSNGFEILELGTRELYLNDPQEVDEDRLMTEIQIPVSKEKGDE